MATTSNAPAGPTDGDSAPKGQHIVAEARQLLNQLEFDPSCGAALKGEHVIVSVMPGDAAQGEGNFRVVVACHARLPQTVTWSTLRVYATPKDRKVLGLLGPSLDRLGHATIDDLPAGEYRLRAYHRAGEAALQVQSSTGATTPLREAVGFRGGKSAAATTPPGSAWTVLTPQVCSHDDITLHRSVSGKNLRIQFSSDNERWIGAEVEFCVVLRETGEQLLRPRVAILQRVGPAESGGAACRTDPVECALQSEQALEIYYRIVETEVHDRN